MIVQNITRLEVRYFGKEVPIKHLSDYQDLAKMDVFNLMEINYFTKKKLLEYVKQNPKYKDRIFEFIDVVEKEGFHFARKKFNKNRNFYRTIEPIIKEIGKSLHLSKMFRYKVKHKIIGDFKIDEYFGFPAESVDSRKGGLSE